MGSVKTIVLVDGEAPPPFVPSKRFTLALLVFFAFIVQYSQRVNLPIGIVCMVNRTKSLEPRLSQFDNTTLASQLLIKKTDHGINSSSNTNPKSSVPSIIKGGFLEEKQFNWIEFQQQLLLGGYWAGYIFTQVPGGWLATNIGAKWVYAGSLFTSSLATLALTSMYTMASTHFILLFILRCVIGIAHGVLFPATIALWSVWAVPQERSTLASIGFCGTHLGTSLTMLSGGFLCRYMNAGWMYLFTFTSFLGFIWFVLWVSLTADSPTKHPTISNHERDYICNLTGNTGKKRNMSLATMPWKNMLKCRPLQAVFISHIANLFGLFFFLTNLGKILTELHRVPTQLAGNILSFGFFLTLLSSLFSGIIADNLVRAKVMTLTSARKFFNSLTSFIPVLCMISLYFCDASNQLMGIITILVFLAASGLGYGSGYCVNFSDIVPAYSGVVFGVANTFASLAGFTGNMVAGVIVKKPVLEQWRILFVIFGVVYFIGGLVFLCFGSAVPRKWAQFQNTQIEKEKKLNDDEDIPMNEPTPVKA